MYPVGVLFGLGFDTATEVGLLGIVATSGSTHLPVAFIMVFPLMFMAGMTVIDTTDSVLMLGAYGWAFVKPIRKLYYNLNITLISVLVALVIGDVGGTAGRRPGTEPERSVLEFHRQQHRPEQDGLRSSSASSRWPGPSPPRSIAGRTTTTWRSCEPDRSVTLR